jgi:hypothetical protein
LGKLVLLAVTTLLLTSGAWAQTTQPSHQKADFGFSYLWIDAAKSAAENNPIPDAYVPDQKKSPPYPNWSVGIVVTGVTDKSAAATAGLAVDDIIVQVDGREIDSADDTAKFVNDAIPGKHYKLRCYRYDTTMERWNSITKEIVPEVDWNSVVYAAQPETAPTTLPDFDGAYLREHRNGQKWEYGFINYKYETYYRGKTNTYSSYTITTWTDGAGRVSVDGVICPRFLYHSL